MEVVFFLFNFSSVKTVKIFSKHLLIAKICSFSKQSTHHPDILNPGERHPLLHREGGGDHPAGIILELRNQAALTTMLLVDLCRCAFPLRHTPKPAHRPVTKRPSAGRENPDNDNSISKDTNRSKPHQIWPRCVCVCLRRMDHRVGQRECATMFIWSADQVGGRKFSFVVLHRKKF